MDAEKTATGTGSWDFAALLKALQEPDPEARVAALQAMGRLGDPRAVAVLRDALRDETVEVRRTAARALYRLLGDQADEVLERESLSSLLRFRAPEEILSSATGVRLFLQTLEVVGPESVALDLEHGDGTVVSGSPLEDYRALTLRNSGGEAGLEDTVARILAFFRDLSDQPGGWWTVGPARGAGIIAFRHGDRFDETLHELATVRVAPERFLTLVTRCRYADWD